MSEKKRANLYKPPVPARPKNLVVLNSKHLPKPPETFSSENVSRIIKELNLDVQNDENEKKEKTNSCQRFENSDSEEDTYGYLVPESLSATNSTAVGKVNAQMQHKNLFCEESLKFGDIFKKVINRNGSGPGHLVAKPIGANLGRRLTREMADFGFNFKRRLQKVVKIQAETIKHDLEVIPEAPEVEESKPQISQSQSQRQRPLPSLPLPPVETKSVVATMPWYKNVDRKRGEEILRNGVDGYFLVRPSSNTDTYLTLTLWHNTRTYNIPIRKRKDGKFALGTPKTHEQCFDSVEYLVKNYQSEKLVLYSNGVQTGKTLLTTYPP